MPLITAVSFEADDIKIVTVQSTRSGITAERYLTLQATEFDTFLSIDKSAEYLVAINPPEAIFETIHIPPTDKKLEAPLIHREAARLHPELGDFVCAYSVLGDVPIEGKVIRKIACCLISTDVVMPALDAFIRHKKNIRQMVATPHILSALVAEDTENTANSILCAHDNGQQKTLFLLENGAVCFSRSISSNGYGWDPLDRQNVSMTMDYCFQSLRIRPERVLVLTPSSHEDESTSPPHLEYLKTPRVFQGMSEDTLQKALVPLTLAAYHFPSQNDLLPLDYCANRFTQKVFKKGFFTFSGIAILLLVMITYQLFSIIAVNETIRTLRMNEGHLRESVNEHQAVMTEKDSLSPIITSLHDLHGTADIPHTLVVLDKLKVNDVRLTSLALKRDKETITLNLAGSIVSTGFAQTQQRFESFGGALQQLPGMRITNKQLDPKSQTCTIDAVYKP
jgi:hypothetical protein